MCGITGFIDARGNLAPDELARLVRRMCDALSHRGPDDEGLFVDENAGLAIGHRRLAVVDPTPAGAQPMSTADGRYTLVFNGEIYNAPELRDSLDGFAPRGHSDTEVLLQVLARHGAGALDRLNGMFALALYDAEQRRLLIARDRFGQKPVYYSFNPARGWFAFSSELRPFRFIDGFDDSIDTDALAQYLLLQYVHAPRSIQRGARKLPPGTYIEVTWERTPAGIVGITEPHRFFSWNPGRKAGRSNRISAQRRPARSFNARVEQLDKLIEQAVERRLMSDVPLGAMLSGGVDSALVVAAMTRLTGRKVRTFSIGFEGSPESEHEEARQTAQLLGTDHHDEIIAPQLMNLLPTIAEALDEPLGDSGCLPIWCLSRLAREQVTVTLTGDGGDEMFGGYQRYADTLDEQAARLWRLKHYVRTGQRWNPADAYCSPRWWMFQPEQVGCFLAGDLPDGVSRTAAQMRAALNDRRSALVHRMRFVDASTYMPGAVLAKLDRMTMAHGLEARSPFLDPDVAAFAEQITVGDCYRNGELKHLLRSVLKKRLPAEIADRPKRGFGLPSACWSQGQMLDLADELILAPDSRTRDLLDIGAVGAWLTTQRRADRFSVFQLWTLLMLEVWLRSLAPECEPAPRIATVSVRGSIERVS